MKICVLNPILGRDIGISLKNQPNPRDFASFWRISFNPNCRLDKKWLFFLNQSSDNPRGQSFPLKKLKKADYLSELSARMGEKGPKLEIGGSKTE